ncbi:apoptosis regulator BAX-like isoform X1 [Xyrichtys novacula]|uniref:Apoptosis regulator BAX-like isoform X1 n=1 Tax=Xyrichtys novacula TaxID=13765 RepID=A0AAV1GP33_XYRNO|nr:apoptosis regulator BAX-like isoform X1 [Xyrichtys novacula]
MISYFRNGCARLRVIQEELKDVPSEEIPPLTPLAVELKTEQERKIVTQLGIMVRIVGDKVKDDQEFQDAIDGIASCSGSKWESFKAVADKVFEHGITWENIAVLFYVAGKLALKLVEAHLPQSVRDILSWTVEFFRNNLLGWIRDHGGWINSFSDLAVASVQSVSSMSSSNYGLVLIFSAGLLIGSFITWRFSR